MIINLMAYFWPWWIVAARAVSQYLPGPQRLFLCGADVMPLFGSYWDVASKLGSWWWDPGCFLLCHWPAGLGRVTFTGLSPLLATWSPQTLQEAKLKSDSQNSRPSLAQTPLEPSEIPVRAVIYEM